MVWAQMSAPAASEVAELALRRWFEGLTLSSTRAAPSAVGLWAGLLGLLTLLAVAVLVQGPRRALGQLFDVPGHLRLLGAALWRLRNAGRVVAVLLGALVLSWTVSQFPRHDDPARLDDLDLVLRSRTLGELALEQGVLTGLTPLRDLCGLGDALILLIPAVMILFKRTADRWSDSDPYPDSTESRSGRVALGWIAGWLYAMYRLADLVVPTGGLPLGGYLWVEAGVVPVLMILSDGLLLAWVLTELRHAGLSDDAGTGLDVRGTITLWPAATLACAVVLPARYVALTSWLLLPHLPQSGADPFLLTPVLRGTGLIWLQGAALAGAGLAGAAAWSRGSPGSAWRLYAGMLRARGGRLVATLAAAGLACGGLAALAYAVVLSLPRQPWLLMAADSYAHYVSLVIGLVLLASLVELSAESLPPSAPALETAPETPSAVPDAA